MAQGKPRARPLLPCQKAHERPGFSARTCGWCLPILTSSWWMSWRTVELEVWMRAMTCGARSVCVRVCARVRVRVCAHVYACALLMDVRDDLRGPGVRLCLCARAYVCVSCSSVCVCVCMLLSLLPRLPLPALPQLPLPDRRRLASLGQVPTVGHSALPHACTFAPHPSAHAHAHV